MPALRHAILGVGGVGGLIGASLARLGDSVTAVVKPQSLASYPEQLKLESPFGNIVVPVARSAEVPPVDVLWIAVKATQLQDSLAALTHPESVGAIVPLLNGIDHLAWLRSEIRYRPRDRRPPSQSNPSALRPVTLFIVLRSRS